MIKFMFLFCMIKYVVTDPQFCTTGNGWISCTADNVGIGFYCTGLTDMNKLDASRYCETCGACCPCVDYLVDYVPQSICTPCYSTYTPCTNWGVGFSGYRSSGLGNTCSGDCSIKYGVTSGIATDPSLCKCKEGYKSSSGYYPEGCTPCGVGYFSTQGAPKCDPCIFGTGQMADPSGGTTHTSIGSCEWICKAGYKKVLISSVNMCVPCLHGTYSISSGLTELSSNVYTKIPVAGSGQTENTYFLTCNLCPLGSVQILSGMTSCTTCDPSGKLLDYNGYQKNIFGDGAIALAYGSPCNQCGCGACNMKCTACEISGPTSCDNMYNVYYVNCTKTNPGTCQSCTYSTASSSCPAGRFLINPCSSISNPILTKYVDSSCSLCNPGTYSNQSSLTTVCTQCSTGTYASGSGATVCKTCTNPPQTNSEYIQQLGQIANSATCPTGCKAGSKLVQSTCVACSTGTYSTGINMPTCTNCVNALPTGTYLIPVSLSNIINCAWTCPVSYYKNITDNSCTKCPQGKYNDRAIQYANETQSCFPCTACTLPSYTSRVCLYNQNTACSNCSTNVPSLKFVSQTCRAGTTDSLGSNTVFTTCRTNCSVGMFMSDTCYPGRYDIGNGKDTVCSACGLPNCPLGLYMPGMCPGTSTKQTRCIGCTPKSCADGFYKRRCREYSDTTCVAYTKCPNNTYLKDFTLSSDGTCSPCLNCLASQTVLRACNNFQNTECSTNVTCSLITPCSKSTTQQYYCDFDGTSTPSCGLCPSGYSSDGIQCQPCPTNVTCDKQGKVTCTGMASAGYNAVCLSYNSMLESSSQQCVTPDPAVTDKIVTRSSYSNAPSADCAAYFQCNPGTYMSYYPQGEVECDYCVYTLTSLEMWTSSGLTPDNPNTCLKSCDPQLSMWNGVACVNLNRTFAPSNSVGKYSSITDGVMFQIYCPLPDTLNLKYYTSRANAAVSVDDCVVCPTAPANGMYNSDYNYDCAWKCNLNFLQRGDMCTSQYLTGSSDTVGITTIVSIKSVTAFPYQYPGQEKTGTLPFVYTASAYTKSNITYINGYKLVIFKTTPTYNMSFWTVNVTTPTNKIVLNILPGNLCSSTAGVINNQTYLYMVFCNQSFITYTAISSSGSFLFTPQILIGSQIAGYVEGSQDSARFGPELYIAAINGSRILLVDTWHCVLRLINIPSFPGNFLTTSYLLAGTPSMCRDTTQMNNIDKGIGQLNMPKQLFPILNNSVFLFTTATAIYQFSPSYMLVSQVLIEGVDTLSILNIYAMDNYTLYVQYANKTVAIQASFKNCSDGTTSLAGSSCAIRCLPDHYVDALGNCVNCNSQTIKDTCQTDYQFIPCSSRAPPSNTIPCPPITNISGKYSKKYTVAGSCDINTAVYVFPCPKNYYPLTDQTCSRCPTFSFTTDDSATSIEQCKCVKGAAIVNLACIIGQPYPTLSPNPCRNRAFGYYDRLGTCVSCSIKPCPECNLGFYSTSNCICLPCNYPMYSTATTNGFVLDNPASCSWECNTAYYQANSTSLSCLPCVGLPQNAIFTSRGQRGYPSSCEWDCILPRKKGWYRNAYTCS